MPAHPWPEELTLELRRLRREGYTYTQIARMMGFSKGKVAGKCDRLDLPATGQPKPRGPPDRPWHAPSPL